MFVDVRAFVAFALSLLVYSLKYHFGDVVLCTDARYSSAAGRRLAATTCLFSTVSS